MGQVSTIVDAAADFFCMALTDEHDGFILHAAIGAQQTNVLHPVNTESTTGPVVILFFVDDNAEIVGLKLDVVQLRVELLDLATVLNAVVLFPQPLDFHFDSSGIGLGIRDAVQLVQPPEHLAVGQGDDLVISPGLSNRKRQLPLRFTEPAAMQLVDILLTN